MNTKQAYRKAVAKWGKTAAVEDRGQRLSGTRESREAAARSQRELIDRLKAEKGHRSNWAPEERMRVTDLCGDAMRFRYYVGKIEMGMFFAVKGTGDTWDEAFAKADR